MGRELGRKPRPVLIVSDDDAVNQTPFEKVIVVPATTQQHKIACHVPWTVRTPRGPRTTYICCEDVRSISTEHARLKHQIGIQPVPAEVMAGVEDWLVVLLGLRRARPES
ncbi:MAG: type II toxin-antitoxin system PemK/MazF family toxin [Chloroflexota bacterium]